MSDVSNCILATSILDLVWPGVLGKMESQHAFAGIKPVPLGDLQ